MNSNPNMNDRRVFPSHCRMAGKTYKAKLSIHIVWEVDGEKFGPEEKNIGEIPIMVKVSFPLVQTIKSLNTLYHSRKRVIYMVSLLKNL